jgi:hypothetical protein
MWDKCVVLVGTFEEHVGDLMGTHEEHQQNPTSPRGSHQVLKVFPKMFSTV